MRRALAGAAAILIAAAPSLSGQDALVDTARFAWRATTAPGIEWTESAIGGTTAARHSKLVIVRVDPARARFSLVQRTAAGGAAPGWTIKDTPAHAAVALNAGQFTGTSPWGWVLRDGVERLSPARGPLSAAFAVTRSGEVLWVDGDSLDAFRARTDVAIGFQSYPALLAGRGETPRLFADVNQTQRDTRLALGLTADRRVLIVLSRFDGLGGALGAVPYGLTTPEMRDIMRALGAEQAMLLDGGITAQMLIRTPAGTERWSGLRRTPLALVIAERRERR